MIKGVAGQSIGAQMINATTGAAFVGTTTVYITIDAGVQTIGSVGSGLCTAEGNGYYSYLPSQSETNGNLIAFTFIGTGAIPTTIQVATILESQQSAIQAVSATLTTTWAALIKSAFLRINVIQSNETPSPDDQAIAFARLQELVDGYSAERLTQPFIQRTTWTITSAKGTLATPYTVGTGGDVNVPRPTFIDHINYQNLAVSPTLELPLSVLTDDAWAGVPQKDLTSPLPTTAYYQPTSATGFGSLYLWMVPTQANLQGVLYAPSAVAVPGLVTDSVLLPPAYRRFLRDNLAVELAPEWRENVPVDPTLLRAAAVSMANIKRLNMTAMDMAIDPAVTARHAGVYNIFSDGNY